MNTILNDASTWGAEAGKINANFLEAFPITLFPNTGYINSSGAIGVDATRINTGFTRYFRGDLVVSGYASATTYLVFFYDKYFTPISSYTTTAGIKNNITITSAEVPVGTYWMISQARSADNNAKLTKLRSATDYEISLADYKDMILMLDSLDDTYSIPTITAGVVVNILHKNAANVLVRTDSFTFSDTEIVESRVFAGVTKTITVDLTTLKTTIL